jgi:hypothetical protein
MVPLERPRLPIGSDVRLRICYLIDVIHVEEKGGGGGPTVG